MSLLEFLNEPHWRMEFDDGDTDLGLPAADTFYYDNIGNIEFGDIRSQILASTLLLRWDVVNQTYSLAENEISFKSVGAVLRAYPIGHELNYMYNTQFRVTGESSVSVVDRTTEWSFGASYEDVPFVTLPANRPIPPTNTSIDPTVNTLVTGEPYITFRANLTGQSATIDLSLPTYVDINVEAFIDPPYTGGFDGGGLGITNDVDPFVTHAVYFYFFDGNFEIPPLRLTQRDDKLGTRPTPRLSSVQSKSGATSAQANDLRITSTNRYDTGFGNASG